MPLTQEQVPYLDLDALPPHNSKTKWPLDEWEKIPPGKALQVAFPEGRDPRTLTRSLQGHQGFRQRGLRFTLRGDAVYVFRPQEEPR